MKKHSSPLLSEPLAGTGSMAFTLIELITTISIVLILAALALPTIGKMTEKARSSKCLNVIKQWGMGFQLYITDHDGKLPQAEETSDNADSQWQEKIAPYLVGGDGVINKQRFIMRARYRCPSEKVSTGIVYGGNTYLRATQYSKAPSKLVSLNQKLSTFMLLGENYTGEIWDPRPRGVGQGVDYSRHKIGNKEVATFLFADFHAEAMSYQDTIDRQVVCIP